MSDRLRESVSALMDGEVEELELRRLLSARDSDIVRSSWQRYHRLQLAMKGESTAFVHWDISTRVSSLIDDDPLPVNNVQPKNKYMQALASFTVAASVAAVVVFTAGDLGTANPASPASQPETLSRVFPASAGVTVSAGSSVASASPSANAVRSLPGADARANEEARKRLDRYMLRHTESAALNNGQGMISYARLANFNVE